VLRLLVDTHVLLGLFDPPRESFAAELAGGESSPALFVSVASLWEIAIKVRQGKLGLAVPVSDLEVEVERFGCTLLPVAAAHATAEVAPWPATNDPFDRLLLAVCVVERLRLVTRDSKLVSHPLAWRPSSA